ncbi:MAG TPA: hypothetical protein VFA21_20105 [Pyrinomonadaceae bacterium]|jgi:hypothetical protein|nr:hypothetical protein [Pyrinomonadaceae bacterium]
MFTAGRVFLTGVLLFICGVLIPFALRVAAGVLGLNQGDRYATLYYSDMAMGFAVIVGCVLIVVGIVLKRRRRQSGTHLDAT